jgi:hypothetical protein
MTTPRERITQAAAEALQALDEPVADLTVNIIANGVTLAFTGNGSVNGQAIPEAPVPANMPASWAWFSAVEQAIVGALQGGAWRTTADLAQDAGESANGRIRGILTNLVDRHVLESDRNKGFRLSGNVVEEPPGEEGPGVYRSSIAPTSPATKEE